MDGTSLANAAARSLGCLIALAILAGGTVALLLVVVGLKVIA
jgi:hypothetical protein